MGRTEFLQEDFTNPFIITERSETKTHDLDGYVRVDGLVMGSYIHGIFDNDLYRRSILNAIRVRKGLAPLENIVNTARAKQDSYDRLADTVRKNLNMDLLKEIMAAKQ
jgi:adenosylcobyric acid synthase